MLVKRRNKDGKSSILITPEGKLFMKKYPLELLLTNYFHCKLERTREGYRCLCPLHSEKTPSFMINTSKNVWNCFGCGNGGDTISLFNHYHNGNGFLELAKYLESEMTCSEENVTTFNTKGLNTPKEATNNNVETHINAYNACFQLYRHASDNHTIKQIMPYMADETISNFGLCGINSPVVSMGLKQEDLDYLVQMGEINDHLALSNIGIVAPIRDLTGNTLGFVTRTPVGYSNKYILSRSNDHFRKGDCLYGLYEALVSRANTHTSSLIVTEGMRDVLALVSVGLSNAVALLGCSMSNNQMQLLLNNSTKLTFCLDSDEAGIKGMASSLCSLLPHIDGRNEVFFAFISHGKDPDEILQTNGPVSGREALFNIMRSRISYYDMLLHIAVYCDLAQSDSEFVRIQNAVNLVRCCKPVMHSYLLHRFARCLKLDYMFLKDVLNQNEQPDYLPAPFDLIHSRFYSAAMSHRNFADTN